MSPEQSAHSLKKFLLPAVGITIAVVIVCAVVQFSFKSNSVHRAAFEMRVGAEIPEVTLRKFEGPEIKLSSLPYRVKMVNFWASWCEACMLEMPSIIALRSRYSDKGFEV